MARSTKTSTGGVEAQALAASSKSEGMRLLFEAGRTVSEVSKIMNAPYAFVYGVAKRAGKAETAAKRRLPKVIASEAKRAATVQAKAKATATVSAAAKAATKYSVQVKATPTTKVKVVKPVGKAKAKGAAIPTHSPVRVSPPPVRAHAVLPARASTALLTPKVTKVPGRPGAARRAANRKAELTSGR